MTKDQIYKKRIIGMNIPLFTKVSDNLWCAQVSKCGLSTFAYMAHEYYQAHTTQSYYIFGRSYYGDRYMAEASEINSTKMVCYRDPIKRFLSFYNNKIINQVHDSPFVERFGLYGNGLAKVINMVEIESSRLPVHLRDPHIRRQCDFYNPSDVDYIVPFEHLDAFLLSQGVQPIEHQNSSGDYHIELTPEQEERLRKLYADDYKILNSPKIWKP